MRNYFFVFVLILFFVIFGCDFVFAQLEQERVRDRFWQVLVESPRRGVVFERVYNFYAQSNTIEQFIDKGLELSRAKPEVSSSWLLLGLIYERCGELEKGIEACGRAVELDAGNSIAFYYLGEMLIAQGNLREAVNMLEKSAQAILKFAKLNTAAQQREAVVQGRSLPPIPASVSLRNKPTSKHELRSVLLLLGKTAERLGDAKKADAVWSQLEQLYPNNPEIINIITNILESEGRIDEAIKRYEQYTEAVLKSEKLNTQVQLSGYNFVRFKLAVIGLKLRKSGEFSPVEDYAELLDKVESGGWLAEIVRKRLELYFSARNDFVGLANFYKERLKNHPNEPAVILQLANLLVKLDRKNEALELLNNSIAKFPNDILLRRAIIDIFVTENQLDKAIAQYQQIIAINPTDSSNLIALSELIMKTDNPNKLDEAKKIWSRIIDLSPNDAMTFCRVAELAVKYNAVDIAEKYYKQAIALRPDDMAFREYLGFFYYSQAEIKKAVTTIQSIAEGERQNAESLVHAGTLLMSIHADNEAFTAFENAAKLAPKNSTIKLKYIESLLRRGEIDNAVAQLSEADQLILSDDEFDIFLRNEIKIVLQSSQIDSVLKKLTNKILCSSRFKIRKAEHGSATTWSDCSRAKPTAHTGSGIDKSPNNSATKKPRPRSYWRLAIYNQYAGKNNVAVEMMDAAIEYPNYVDYADVKKTQVDESLSPKILQAAAELYVTCNATDKAIKILQILVAQNNIRQAVYLRQLAELQIKSGDKDAATKTINRLLDSGKANATVAASCAELLFNLGRIKDAIDLLRRGSRSKPNDLLLQKMLIEYLAKDGQLKNAIDTALRLFDRFGDVENKMQLAKTIAEYCTVANDVEKNNDKLKEFLYKIRILPDKRSSVLCAAVVFEVLSDFNAARSELEGFLIAAGGGQNADKLLLQKLVSVTEKLHDYEAAVKYQELICKNNSDAAEFDKLFILYDINGNREKSSQLFMQQILNKTELNDQLNMIDRMICREEYDAVEHVLAFFEIHEEPSWEIMYRQVAIAAYKKQKNLPDLVKNFRKQKFINSPKNNNSNNTNHSTDDQLTKYLEAQFNNSAWNFSNNLPTKDFTIWKKDSDAQQIIFRQQEIFLLTLCREQLQRNPNYRTFNNVPPPKPFYQADNFAEAKFLALCWLLRETNAEKIINTCEPTPEEIKRLKALEESMKKIQHREQEKTRN